MVLRSYGQLHSAALSDANDSGSGWLCVTGFGWAIELAPDAFAGLSRHAVAIRFFLLATRLAGLQDGASQGQGRLGDQDRVLVKMTIIQFWIIEGEMQPAAFFSE